MLSLRFWRYINLPMYFEIERRGREWSRSVIFEEESRDEHITFVVTELKVERFTIKGDLLNGIKI